MARVRGKKALYEVISQRKPKPGCSSGLEQEQPSEQAGNSVPAVEAGAEAVEKPAVWPRRPRIVQFNAGRIEVSLPYEAAVAVILLVLLLVLVVFRLGQKSYVKTQGQGADSGLVSGLSEAGRERPTLPPRPAESSVPRPPVKEPTVERTATGGNVIVIVQYKRQLDLVPVQQHFGSYGVETEILKIGDRYFLVTKNRYNSPDTSGTDGYEAKKKIIEVGALYKGRAPEGYESFAPKYFSDAYGMKMN